MSPVNVSTSPTTRTLAFEVGRRVHGSLKRYALCLSFSNWPIFYGHIRFDHIIKGVQRS